MKTLTALIMALALLCTACGGDDDDASSGDGAAGGDAPEEVQETGEDASEESPETDGDAPEIEVDAEEFAEDPEAAAEELADQIEEVQEARGGGSATLVVGDQTWTFDSVLCAFGEEEIGQEGAEFVLSSIQDGLQMYASIDSFGHSVSLDDIEDFENPSVALSAFGDGFVNLDGKSVQADAEFFDGTSDAGGTVQGTFEATCP